MRISVEKFTWMPKRRTFVEEVSSIKELRDKIPGMIILENPKTGGVRAFLMTEIDEMGGDIYGWRYASVDGLKILLIND